MYQFCSAMKQITTLAFLLLFTTAFAQPDTTQKVVENRTNSASQRNKPYVILISVDGFRHDYARLYGAEQLLKKSAEGVQAGNMQPSFPSLTFPNHYSIVTGMYPSHHGLVGNSFYNRSLNGLYTMRSKDKVGSGAYYGGKPLWVLAEQQNMLSASFYWVGSEADIEGVRPTYYYVYNEEIPLHKRIEEVVKWMKLPEEKRPHLITFYFPEVDHAGHSFGPNSLEVKNAVRWVDTAIAKLVSAVDALGLNVNYVVVSDHGMTQIDQKNTLEIPMDTSRFVYGMSQEIINVYAKDTASVNAYYEQLKKVADGFSVYKKSEVPAHLHYGAKDDVYNRIGDLVVIPEWPRVFSGKGRKPKPGSHGFDPTKIADMGAIFYAWGPAFKKTQICTLNNVDVFPVITEILGLRYNHKIDGSEKLKKEILR